MKLHDIILKLLLTYTFFCSTTASYAVENPTPQPPVEKEPVGKQPEGKGAFAHLYSLVTQTPASGVGMMVKMETVESINNIELSPTSDLLIIKQSGTYLVLITTQVGATTPGANGYVDFWAIKNGKSIPNSNNRQSIVTSNFASTIATAYILPLAAGDTIGTMLSASGPSLGLIYIRPNREPAIPSMNFLITRL